MFRVCYDCVNQPPASEGSGVGVNGMAPTMTWTRVSRRLGLDHNPLRRRLDLLHAWLLPAAAAAFVILGPLVGTVAGLQVQAQNVAAQHAEQFWQPVPAVLLQAAPGPMMSDNGANTWLVWTPARWTAGGRLHVGRIPAPADTSAGGTTTVWLDSAGRVQTPPLTAAGAADRVTAAVSVSLAACAALLTGLALLGHLVLDRRRLAAWETAWLMVGPQWSRHG